MTNEELLEFDLNNQEEIKKVKASKKYKKLKHLIKDKIHYYKGLFFQKTNEFQNISFVLKKYRINSKIIIKNEFNIVLEEIPFSFILKDHLYGMNVFHCDLPKINKTYYLFKGKDPFTSDFFWLTKSVMTKINKTLYNVFFKNKSLNNLTNKFYIEFIDIKKLNKKTLIHKKAFEYNDGYGCKVRQTNFVKTIYNGMDSKNLFIAFPSYYDDFYDRTYKRPYKEKIKDKQFLKYKKSFFHNQEEI